MVRLQALRALRALAVVAGARGQAHDPGSYGCNASEADANDAAFMALGGKHASACPRSAVWLGPLARDCLPEDGDRNVLVVGGNKAYDCVGWARLAAGDAAYSAAAWTRRLEAAANATAIPCGECKQCRSDYPLVSRPAPSAAAPVVACVEPLPANVDALKVAAAEPPWARVLRVVDAAAMDAPGSAPFPVGLEFGMETWGVRRRLRAGRGKGTSAQGRGRGANPPYDPPRLPAASAFRNVTVTTVDDLVDAEFGGGRRPGATSVISKGSEPESEPESAPRPRGGGSRRGAGGTRGIPARARGPGPGTRPRSAGRARPRGAAAGRRRRGRRTCPARSPRGRTSCRPRRGARGPA